MAAQRRQGTVHVGTGLNPYKKNMNVNFLIEDNMERRLRGPEREQLQKWWTSGTTQECLLSEGADL
eukprot:10921981-Prorocentrum_lima.AAC.1